MANNSNDTTPIESRWNGTRLFIIPQLMNRNKVEQFIKKNDGFYAVLRKPSEAAIKQANNEGYKNVIGVLSFLTKDNKVAHIYLPKDYVEINDVYEIAKMSNGNDNIELLVTEESMLDAKNVHNFSRMTGHGRSKKSKSRRSKSRRSKKSKGRSRRHRK